MVDGPALSPLRAAIIGLGNIAWKYDVDAEGAGLTHTSTYAADPRTQLVTGFDPDPAQRSAFTDSTGISAVPMLDNLLATKPDIVSICSPNALHAAHLRACLEAKVPMIWLEKPATTNADESRQLIELQRALGASTVLVGFQRRYQPIYQRLNGLMHDQALGRCAGISITYSRGLETNGVHLIDVLFQLLGDSPYELVGVTPASGPAASPSFLLQFDGGIPCTVTGLSLDHHSIDLTVHFAAGRASVLYGGASEVREFRIENPLYPGFYRLAPDPTAEANAPALLKDAQATFPSMLDDLITAHRDGREPASSLTSSLAAQELVERVLSLAAAR